MEFYIHEQDNETTIDTIKEILEKKFPSYYYKFKKPLFDKRYLNVIKDNLVSVMITLKKGKVKIFAWESNVWARSVRQTMPIAAVLTESKFIEFEKQISTYLVSYFEEKRIKDGIRKGSKVDFIPEEHSKYMPK